MAKFQLCMFLRERYVSPLYNTNKNWERGIAKVNHFGDNDVEFIIDELGRKVKNVWAYKLLMSYAHSTIDTELTTVI